MLISLPGSTPKKFQGATFQDIFATLFARALVLATSPELYSPTGPALYVTIEPAESHFTLDWSQGPIPRNTKPVDTKSGLLLHTLLLFRCNFFLWFLKCPTQCLGPTFQKIDSLVLPVFELETKTLLCLHLRPLSVPFLFRTSGKEFHSQAGSTSALLNSDKLKKPDSQEIDLSYYWRQHFLAKCNVTFFPSLCMQAPIWAKRSIVGRSKQELSQTQIIPSSSGPSNIWQG